MEILIERRYPKVWRVALKVGNMPLNSLSDAKALMKGNVRVFALRGVLLTVGGGLTGGLDALYVKTILHADAIILGLFASIWSAIYVVFILIGGWISDRYDRKRIFLIGTALTLPNSIIYALAPTWHVLLVANFLGALGSALANPAYTAMLVTSVEQQKRSRVIATINTLASLANMVIPPLGAFFIEWIGGLNEIRTMFVLQFALFLGVWVYTFKAMGAQPVTEERDVKGFKMVVKDILRQMGEVYHLSRERRATPWLYIALTGPLAWGVAGPFWTIYAAEACGSPLFVIGLLAAVYSLINVLFQIPLAGVADKRGRRHVILMGRPFTYLCLIALILGGTFRDIVWASYIPILAWILLGIGDSVGPSWTAASTEVMPEELQGRWNALQNFIWFIVAIPAGLIGGVLWDIDPRIPFITALAVDALIRFPILLYQVPETLMVRHVHPHIGPHVVIYGLTGAGQTSIARLVQRMTRAEIIDGGLIKGERVIEKQVDEILEKRRETTIIEGKPAVFAAREPERSMIVLLVAPKEERVRRKSKGSGKPEFVTLKEVEDEDRKIGKLTKKLYGADISKLPPFDVAINTDRVSPEKVAKIISLLREEGEEEAEAGA